VVEPEADAMAMGMDTNNGWVYVHDFKVIVFIVWN